GEAAGCDRRDVRAAGAQGRGPGTGRLLGDLVRAVSRGRAGAGGHRRRAGGQADDPQARRRPESADRRPVRRD
ncbi:MAG: Thioredoxin, partial [uncultured Thermomicrobiales bacterium]